MRIRVMFALILAVACATGTHPTPIAPAPTRARVAGSTAMVLQAAVRSLASSGFEVSSSDAAIGSLTAKRVRGPKAQRGAMSCHFADESILANNQQSTFTISMSVQPVAPDSSDVVIRGSVFSEYPGLNGGILAKTGNTTDCASNNSVETSLRDSLTATRR